MTGRKRSFNRWFSGPSWRCPRWGVDDVGVPHGVENWLVLHVALREAEELIGSPRSRATAADMDAALAAG
jgi:hypothetical protein